MGKESQVSLCMKLQLIMKWLHRMLKGKGLGRPDLCLAVPGATADYATSVHAAAVDPASPRERDFH